MALIPILEQYRADSVWRYLSFGRFVWMLEQKALWLSRLDLLGDAWEAAPFPAQLEEIAEAVASGIHSDLPGLKYPTNWGLLSGMSLWRTVSRTLYANCWTRERCESHAMWRVYCDSTEAVAMKTTVGRLRESLPDDIELLPVTYAPDPDPLFAGIGSVFQLATQKRPMFSYEKEVRVLSFRTHDLTNAFEALLKGAAETLEQNPSGRLIEWDASKHIESIRIHPQADDAFVDTVRATVRLLAPELGDSVERSEMSVSPQAAYLPLITQAPADPAD